MGRFSDLLRSPFSFLFARTSSEDRVATYLIREHERGRSVDDILEDPYVQNRTSRAQILRVLERPEVIHHLGEGTVQAARAEVSS